MPISADDGQKAPGDKIILYNGKAISIKELGTLLLAIWDNEDLLYPPSKGLSGAKMLMDFIEELYETREMTDEILKKYRLK